MNMLEFKSTDFVPNVVSKCYVNVLMSQVISFEYDLKNPNDIWKSCKVIFFIILKVLSNKTNLIFVS